MKHWIFLPTSLGLCCSIVQAARHEVSLNGAWQMVKVRSLDDPLPAVGWQTIDIPDVVYGHAYERAWFKRTFSIPLDWQGQRVFVRFGGVKYNSQVFVNGRKVGGCFNGYDAFDVDLTEAVRWGEENELRVGVHDWTGIFTGDPVDFSKPLGWDALREVPTDRILGPIGGIFTAYGIWDDVTLRRVPQVYFKELFVRPSVRQQRLEVEVTVANAGMEPFAGNVRARLFAWNGERRDAQGQWPVSGDAVCALPMTPVSVVAGRQQSVILRLEKPPLKPWWPDRPRLYLLELSLNSPVSDTLRERVGFRELWTKGGDFYLNGAKVHLLASSWWPSGKPMSREEIAKQIKALKAMNAVCFRTHTQPWPERWYEVADELGLMMIPEGAVWNDDAVYRVNDPEFWKNYGDHLRAMVRHLRNHASIVMWSLENEFTGGRAKDGSYAEDELAKLGRMVKAEDPTRPITFESDGDPGGVTDVIGIHYPNEYPGRRNWPNDAYWMNEPRYGGGGGGIFWDDKPFLWDHRKPLYIGEYLWVPTSDPGPHTIFFGDEAYKSHDEYRTLGKAFAWRRQMLAYRHYGVSGQSPWTVIEHGSLDESNPCWVAQRDLYRPLAAFLREADSRFFAGETVDRTVEVFNDTMADQSNVTFHWALAEGDRTFTEGNGTMKLLSGEHRELKLQIRMPQVQERRKLGLRITMKDLDEERFREEWPVEVSPRTSHWSMPKNTVLLFDPKEKLCKVWTRDRASFRLLKRLEDWDGKDLLVLGPEALAKTKGEAVPVIGGQPGLERMLSERVQSGGRVLVLEQTDAASNSLPVSLSNQSSTMSFPQNPSHPVLKGLSAEDFRWWRGDNLVSQHEPVRPTNGALRPLVVTGTSQGLSHAPLLEVPQGKGVWLICQLQVVTKLNMEPVAHILLERMLHYLASYKPVEGVTFCVGGTALQENLTRLGVDWRPLEKWESLRWPQSQLLIMQTDGEILARHAEEMRSFLEAGGNVLWHRPSQEDSEKARDLTRIPIERQPYRGPVLRAEGDNPLLESLTREDLYWLGKPGEIPWAARSLATDVAEALFGRRLDPSLGDSHEAGRDVDLEGGIVQVEGNGVIFATVGKARWKVKLPEDGSYVLGLTARGTPVEEVFPMAEVCLDDQRIGALYIGSLEARTYSLAFQAKAGEHRLSVAFTNDASKPPAEDRNLFVDKFLLAKDEAKVDAHPLTVPAAVVEVPVGKGHLILNAIRWDDAGSNTIRGGRFLCSLLTALGGRFSKPQLAGIVEAESLTPQPNLPWYRKEADHAYLGSSGYVEGRVQVAKAGRYRVFIVAKGQPAAGVYPIVALELDGKEIGRVECKSDDWMSHTATVELPAGDFTLRLLFTNDLYLNGEDRNVWIDRLEFERM